MNPAKEMKRRKRPDEDESNESSICIRALRRVTGP